MSTTWPMKSRTWASSGSRRFACSMKCQTATGHVKGAAGKHDRVAGVALKRREASPCDCGHDDHRDDAEPEQPMGLQLLPGRLELVVRSVPAQVKRPPRDLDGGCRSERPQQPLTRQPSAAYVARAGYAPRGCGTACHSSRDGRHLARGRLFYDASRIAPRAQPNLPLPTRGCKRVRDRGTDARSGRRAVAAPRTPRAIASGALH
jgi:hypothetical protein